MKRCELAAEGDVQRLGRGARIALRCSEMALEFGRLGFEVTVPEMLDDIMLQDEPLSRIALKEELARDVALVQATCGLSLNERLSLERRDVGELADRMCLTVREEVSKTHKARDQSP